MKRKQRKAGKGVNGKEEEAKPPKELNKRQELNNHIVCMRNTVSQARVHIISRLVHQIKKYKARKGETKDQEKAKRKAERLVEEIQALKKVKKDKASVYALEDTNDLANVLNDPTATTEEKVLSRVSHHPLIQSKVKQYREANPNWDKQIPVLLRMTQQRRKKKKDPEPHSTTTSIQSETKAFHSSAVSDGSSIAEKFQKIADGKTAFTNGSSASVNKVSKAKRKVEKRTVKSPVREGSAEEEEEEESSTPAEKPSSIAKPKVAPRLNKLEGTVKVQLLSDLNDLEPDNTDETPSDKVFVNITQAPAVKKPKSGFFVGGVDEPAEDKPRLFPSNNQNRYFNNNKQPFNSNSHRSDQSQPREIYRKGKLISKPSFKPRPDFHQNRDAPQFGDRKPYNRFGGNSEPLNPKAARFSSNNSERQFQPRDNSSRQFQPPSDQSNNQAAPAEKLHPSWEAKKKQQQITAFQGKKIVFNDDD